MFVWIVGVASGLRPMACTAPPADKPIPMPAPIVPIIAKPAPKYLAKRVAAAASMLGILPLNKFDISGLVLMAFGVLAVHLCGSVHEHEGQHHKHVSLN